MYEVQKARQLKNTDNTVRFNIIMLRKVVLIFLMITLLIGCSSRKDHLQKPNIIIFLADDLGYGEVGVYGQEKIQTPNIDALAENGMLFTQHYSGAPVCAPARCILLTGKHGGHAFIRGNDEWKERGDVWNYEAACSDPNLEGQVPIPENTITLGKLLKKAGYSTSIFGKWGLGAPGSEGTPNLQGFDYFYGYNCQRQAHNLYPPHLWENNKKDTLHNKLVIPHTRLDSLSDPYENSSYTDYHQQDYAPAKIHNKALQYLKGKKDKPFFMYYASPLPHLPLQAPKEIVNSYRQIFGEEEPYIGDRGYFPNRYPKSTYASMISYLDIQLGELILALKEEGIYDNTLIIFTSDNGPTYTGGVDFEFFESSKPFSNAYGRTKGFVYEGGIRVPFIASWPKHIGQGKVSDHVSAFYDIVPTISEIVGIESPLEIDGISFKSTLLGEEQKKHEFLYWEFPSYKGQQAVRLGKWKGIRQNIFEGNLAIELYDLENDPEEQFDLADQYPDLVKKIEEVMTQEHEPSQNKKFKFSQLGDL